MHSLIAQIIEQPTEAALAELLQAEGALKDELLSVAAAKREEGVGPHTNLRGLIELTNVCAKDCYYCGIRKGNSEVERYDLTDDEVLEAAQFAYDNGFGYVVMQGGELSSHRFVRRVDRLVLAIKAIGKHRMGITLSLGEQKEETYRRWKEFGVNRYLLRIEASDRALYESIHPKDARHDFDVRKESLMRLKRSGILTGTGVMIGLPGQTINHLAQDLLFMKNLPIDMCGMGPYLEQHNTPLFDRKDELWDRQKRFDVSLNMIAILRIMMPHINIAAATAMETILPQGRKMAIQAGGNVVMPNITPTRYKKNYTLYDNKAGFNDRATLAFEKMKAEVEAAGSHLRLFTPEEGV